MPPDVSTSQIRMSRVCPNAWPLSQGSSTQGMRSMVTRTSRMVMSDSAEVIARFPYLFYGPFEHDMATRTTRSRDGASGVSGSLLFRNLENQTGRGGVRQQAAVGVGNARFGSRSAAADIEDAAFRSHRPGVLGHAHANTDLEFECGVAGSRRQHGVDRKPHRRIQ